LETSKRKKPKLKKLKKFGSEYFEFVTSISSETDLERKKKELEARFFRIRVLKRTDRWDVYRLVKKFKKFKIDPCISKTPSIPFLGASVSVGKSVIVTRQSPGE